MGEGASSPGGSTSSASSTATTGASNGAAQVIHVTVSDQQITADHATFYVGQPYRFVVTNTGRITHEFMMAQQGGDYGHMSTDERHHAALYMYDQIAPGQTKSFDYTFPASAVGHTYGFACYQWESHDDQGMWHSFEVRKLS